MPLCVGVFLRGRCVGCVVGFCGVGGWGWWLYWFCCGFLCGGVTRLDLSLVLLQSDYFINVARRVMARGSADLKPRSVCSGGEVTKAGVAPPVGALP